MATSNTAASTSSGQAFGFGTPFVEQLDFFLKKLALPSERWDDIQKSAHDRAFIVAGAAKADLLNDLQAAIGKRIADGKGLEAFRTEFADIVKKHGWMGWTGEGTKAGEAWRTRIIYSTNMSTSYAAGRWQQLNGPALLKLRPYWQYKHSDSVAHPRPHHKAWNGITLPYDHPFWKTHFAPNGWLCHCRIIAVDEATYLRALADGKGVPPEGWDTLDPKTGAPLGIDKGFDYAPGANANTPLRQMVQDKLIKYPPAISKALTHDVNKYIEAGYSAADFASKALENPSMDYPLWLGFVENPALDKAAKTELQNYIVLMQSDAPRHIKKHHEFDGAGQRMPLASDYDYMMGDLTLPDSVRTGEIVSGLQRIVVTKTHDNEVFRWVFEIRPGKRNRSIVPITLAIKMRAPGANAMPFDTP
jgi:Phage Mu protein F like protein